MNFNNRRRGVSLIEVMIALIITVLIMTAVYQVFSQGRKGADEAMRNHQINQDLQRVVDRLQNDIREASGIHPEYPPFYTPGVEKTKSPEDPKNLMVLQRAVIDFKKNPATLATGQKPYRIYVSTYSLQLDSPPPEAIKPGVTPPKCYILKCETTPIDESGNLVGGEKKTETIMEDIDRLIFYRYQTQATTGGNTSSVPTANCIFFDLFMTRLDKEGTVDQKYTGKLTTSVQVRGSMPEGF